MTRPDPRITVACERGQHRRCKGSYAAYTTNWPCRCACGHKQRRARKASVKEKAA